VDDILAQFDKLKWKYHTKYVNFFAHIYAMYSTGDYIFQIHISFQGKIFATFAAFARVRDIQKFQRSIFAT
jgi:hypothetical protein